ncbi:MAG: Re/Si-specific NAD(P)(+) transhydrogenase subunit alpha [Phycisphaerae bacterium]|nr:Re/Si-specific NAD(P)(+) transhydrogenase subunit alpha [Phycisphaerae bacterium]
MIAGVVRETYPGERRVALVPAAVVPLGKSGLEVLIEAGAGIEAGYPDDTYRERGARIAADRAEVFARADVIVAVRGLGANPAAGREDLDRMKAGQIVVGMLDPLWRPEACRELAEQGVAAFSLELMPRITRAQSMDVLSSMATISGYKAVLLAAEALPRMFPMLMTAAGTVTPARVFVVGAGVAGLQAIATARRLGAVVHGYDVRPAVREQVESLGGKFVELPLETAQAEGTGGYAKAMDEAFYRRQREMMAKVVAESDVVITTAAVPGKKSPVLVTAEMVRGMGPGSVIVDLAAERGGNCELSQPDQTVVEGGVSILGPTNLPATIPYHASQLYSKNVVTFLSHLVKDGQLAFDIEDEISRETLVTRDGQVVNDRVRAALGMESPPSEGRAG